ncbi:MAG TPA: hypothetical protein VLG16_05010 [Candidatus Saccharimonadales bacterium]|nr:hypothetical protein [Candidatus Saccharimonadales bacterium]
MKQPEALVVPITPTLENHTQVSVDAGAIIMGALEAAESQHMAFAETSVEYPGMEKPAALAQSAEHQGSWGSVAMKVREHTRKAKAAAGFAVSGAIMLTGTACTSNANSSNQAGQTCFTQLDPSQESQLKNYIQSNSDAATVANNPNGTSDICVIEGNETHYYNQHDNFNDYMLYALMTNRGSDLATFGLLNGDLSLDQALTLQLMTDVQSNGAAYHPYQRTNTGWQEKSTVVNNIHITNVQYGHTPAKTYNASNIKPPKGYVIKPFKAADQTKEGDFSGGKIVGKKVAPANSYINPAKPTQPSADKAPASQSSKSAAPASAQRSTQKPAPAPSKRR